MHRLVLAVLAAVALMAVPASAAKKPASLKFSGGATTLALDPDTAAALTSLGVSVSPLEPARAREAGIAFPITSGRVNVETLAGVIRHSGGLAFTKGDTVVKLRRFAINIDEDPDLTAALGSQRVSILSLDLSGATVTKGKRFVRITGVKAALTAAAANALNQAFGTDALTEGTPVGVASVKARLAGCRHHH